MPGRTVYRPVPRDMIKIAHICEGFLGGVCTHLCAILPRLVHQGFDITLIVSLGRSSPDAEARLAALRRDGVKVDIVPMRRGIRPLEDLRSLVALSLLLSRGRFDIVHTHGSKAGALGRIAAVCAGTPVRLHSPHCFAFLRNSRRLVRLLYLACEQVLGRVTTRLIAVGPSEARVAARRRIVPCRRCSIVLNALPDGRAGTEPLGGPGGSAREGGLHVVTTVCRLVDYKGVFRFLDAARLSQTPNTRFMIAGDGELRDAVMKYIVEHQLEHKVRLLGYVRDMGAVYAGSDVVVLCSDAEAMPYCLLEAMRARCAIVATAVIGNRELVAHDRTGLLVRPDPAQVARAVDSLLADETKRRDLTANAYARFCACHTLDRQVSNLSQIYRSVFLGEEDWARHHTRTGMPHPSAGTALD